MKKNFYSKLNFPFLKCIFSLLYFIVYPFNVNTQNSWTQKTSFPGFATLSFVIGNKGYLGSGKGPLWEYNPTNDTWTQKANFGGIGRDDATGFAIGDKIFIGTGTGDYEYFYSDFWQWDQATNLWSQKSNIVGNPKGYAMGFSIGDKGYIVGGIDLVVDEPELLEYDPATDSWTKKATFPGGVRTEGATFSIGTKGYLGTGSHAFPTQDFWEWEQSTDVWTQKADFGGGPRATATGFSIGNIAFLGMGYNLTGTKDDFWYWDPSMNVWTEIGTATDKPRSHALGFVIGQKGYVVNGWHWLYGSYNDSWEFDPSIINSPSVSGAIICSENAATLTATGIGTIGWYTDSIGGTYLGGGSNYITSSLTNTTVYYVQDSTNFGTSVRTEVLVTVIQIPSVAINLSDTSACSGTPITLSAQGASTYTWSNGIDNGIPFTIDSTTTFTVIGTDTNNCSDTVSILISVNPLPDVTAFLTATEICIGDSISLLATGANSFSWSDSIVNGQSFIPAQTNTYTVIGTDTNNCSDTASITITVNDPEVIAYTTSSSVCEGEEVTLTVSGAVNFSWSGGVLNNTPFLPDSTTTYTAIGTDGINCSDTASITITVHQSPMITVNASETEICIGTPLILTADGTQTYFWSDGIVNNIPFFPFVTKVFFVTGTDSNNCSDTASIKIIVNPLPDVIPYATSTTICEGETVSLIGTGAETYQWSDGISNGVSFIPTSTNSYTVIGIDSNNCSDTVSITVIVNSFPDIMLSFDGATLTANQAQAEYQWLNCEDGFSEISGATEQSYTAAENGNYAVVIDLDGCVDTSECVTVNNVGVADLADGVGRIKVFPNPSPGIFTIQSSVAISSITITNLIGEMIFELKCPLSSCTEQSRSVIEEGIPIRLMEPEGIYFLKIESGSKMEMKKIVLQ